MPKFYGELKGLIDELEMHQPSVTDEATLRGYRQDLAISKFLSGLNPTLRSWVRGQILGGDSILTLTANFSRVMWVSTGADVSSALSIEQSAMVSRRSKGRGRDRDFGGRGRGSVGGGRGSYGGRQSASEKGSRQYRIVDAVITSPKCVGRNLIDLSGHSYLILILLPHVVILKSLLSLFLPLSRLYYRRRSMIDSAS